MPLQSTSLFLAFKGNGLSGLRGRHAGAVSRVHHTVTVADGALLDLKGTFGVAPILLAGDTLHGLRQESEFHRPLKQVTHRTKGAASTG